MTGPLLRILELDALQAAPLLLGAVLTHEHADGTVAIRFSEVEAYHGHQDPGSHAFRGQTPRNAVMFGPSGRLYVYFTYGMHYCANIVCGREGQASAVLLRAGEVVSGLDTARSRRPAARRDRELAQGPARLAQALGLNAAHNGSDVGTAPLSLTLAPHVIPPHGIRSGPRVGVSGPGGSLDFPWRFWLEGDPTVSRYRPAVSRARPES